MMSAPMKRAIRARRRNDEIAGYGVPEVEESDGNVGDAGRSTGSCIGLGNRRRDAGIQRENAAKRFSLVRAPRIS